MKFLVVGLGKIETGDFLVEELVSFLLGFNVLCELDNGKGGGADGKDGEKSDGSEGEDKFKVELNFWLGLVEVAKASEVAAVVLILVVVVGGCHSF